MNDEAVELAERLEAILESAVDGMITIDAHGQIEYVNSAALEMFGYTRSELIGSNVGMLMPSPEREEHDSYIQNYLETGEAHIIGVGREVLGVRKDGTEFPHYLTVSEGTHRGKRLFTGVVRDLSELRNAQERAKAAEQLASLSVIAAGIAHDIGTPMNVILGYAEMLRDSLESPKDQRRAEVIAEQVRRVTDLLQTLLNIARPHEAVRAPLRIDEVAEHALEFFREKLRSRSIQVEHDFADVPEVLGDRDRLEQVFLNLIVNASDAMPEGGLLRVSIGRSEGGWITVSVEDSGHGMDEAARSRVFEPFFTTKERGKGTGLGLVVTKSIVTDHGGTIECESTLGKGTRFVLRFPFKPSENGSRATA